MQFKVPQDVQQADRIVAFLTLPQLIICVVGFAIAYGVYTALYSRGLTVVFWLPPVLVIGGLTISFAFLRIANLPFHQYLALLIERFITPSKRVWVKGSDRVIGEEDYVSPEEKKQQEQAKKNTALQTEKEEKLGRIGEITDILDALKKEPEPLEEIDKTPDEELLQKAFLEKIEPEKFPAPMPKKVERPLEEKILEISSVPRPEQPIQKPPVNEVKPIIAPSFPVAPQATTKPINTIQNAVSEESIKKKRKRRRRKKRSGNPPAGVALVGQTTPQEAQKPSPTPAVPTLPSWLEEKPETPKEPPKVEIKPAEPKAPATIPTLAKEEKKEPPQKVVTPVPLVPLVPTVPTVPTIPTIPTVPTVPAHPEDLLPAPPVEPSLPAPEEHLALEQEYVDAPISPEPPTKTAQVSQSFSAEELKGKGQTIKFPTP